MGYSASADIPYAIVQERTFIRRVYGWMTAGLAVTGLIALIVAAKGLHRPMIESGMYIGLIIAELVVVLIMCAAMSKMSPFAASACFFIYAALNGLTLSVIFLAYTTSSIASTFFVAAGTFGAMSLYGYFTKKDLTGIGSLCFMALFGLILSSIVNLLFVRSAGFDLLISCVGVLVFVGLTAYDTQKIKQIHAAGDEGTDVDKKAAVMGALALYLDFIMLFLYLLRLLGGRRD